MLRCIKRLVVDMLGPILGLIGEDLVENPALGQEAQHTNTSSTKRQRRSRERPRPLLHRATILYGDTGFAQNHGEASWFYRAMVSASGIVVGVMVVRV